MSKKLFRNKIRIFSVTICVVMAVTCIPFMYGWDSGNFSYAREVEDGQDAPAGSDIGEPSTDTTSSGGLNEDTSAGGLNGNSSESPQSNDQIIKMSSADISWYEGHEGSTAYNLTDEQDLQGLSELVKSGVNFKGKTLTLKNDLSDFEILPIGSKDKSFAGTFDGNGKSLNDLKIKVDRKQYIGLFGYATKDAAIKNLDIDGGSLKVEETKVDGEQIRYVGAIVGYMGGKIENCDSSMNISVSSKVTLGKNEGIIRDIGGLAGYIDGDIKGCINTGDISIASASDINKDVSYLVGEIGGIAGTQGDIEDPTKVPATEKCKYDGNFVFSITGKGGVDRFGAQLLSVVYAAGGIIGESSGIVRDCTNSGLINTSNGSESNPEAGRGASYIGGIVGNLRGHTFEYSSSETAQNANFSNEDDAYRYFVAHGGISGKPSSIPKTSGVYDCTNEGNIIGLAAAGGIVGHAGTFTEIEGCANSGDIKGTRWNKPFAAGIVGNTQGNIRYCSNTGDIYSSTGGGYYCAGIAGGLWLPYDSNADDNDRVSATEMTGCYTTGRIYTDNSGYRTGILAGENEGFIHDNVYLKGLTLDNKLVDNDTGTSINNTEFPSDGKKLKGSEGVSKLNAYAAGKGNWEVFYIPSKSNGYPVLSRKPNYSVNGATAIPSGADITLKSNALYSASGIPVPNISIKSGSVELLQNADFYVIPQSGATAVSSGESYQATIVGMGNYSGVFGTKKYDIDKGKISECTIVAEATIFNWNLQRPKATGVKLIDPSGNEIDKTQYTVSDLYDPAKGTGGHDVKTDSGKTETHYYDYTNAHGRNYKYDVRVDATSSSNYQGNTVQAAYRIKWASMNAQLPNDDPYYVAGKPESVLYGDVTWQGKTWDFLTALRDTSGNTIKITYTGQPITPTVTKLTYLGREMRLAKDFDYQEHPLKYDYKYIYGNPNPEETGGLSSEPVNVTKAGKPSSMTVRFTNGGNFDNYVNVFFQIVPASLNSAKVSISDQKYTGKAIKPKPAVIWNGKKLTEGKDYDLTNMAYSSNTPIGKATLKFTVKGKGNFTGSYNQTVTFRINPGTAKVIKLTSAKKSLKVKYKKLSKKEAVTSYQIRYRAKGTSKWKTKTIKASKKGYTIKRLKKGKKYQVQIRGVKKIKKGSSKGTYYGSWSGTKTSKKVK